MSNIAEFRVFLKLLDFLPPSESNFRTGNSELSVITVSVSYLFNFIVSVCESTLSVQ